MPNPVMWGVMVAILNFIPYLGALTGIVCMTLAAILSFPSASYALLFPPLISFSPLWKETSLLPW